MPRPGSDPPRPTGIKVDRIFYCSRTPHCDTHIRTTDLRPSEGVLTLDLPSNTRAWFCSWDCVLAYAGTFEPIEVIPYD